MIILGKVTGVQLHSCMASIKMTTASWIMSELASYVPGDAVHPFLLLYWAHCRKLWVFADAPHMIKLTVVKLHVSESYIHNLRF